MRAREWTQSLDNGSTEWPSQSSAGEFALVVWIRESQQAGVLSYHPDPYPGALNWPTTNSMSSVNGWDLEMVSPADLNM